MFWFYIDGFLLSVENAIAVDLPGVESIVPILSEPGTVLRKIRRYAIRATDGLGGKNSDSTFDSTMRYIRSQEMSGVGFCIV